MTEREVIDLRPGELVLVDNPDKGTLLGEIVGYVRFIDRKPYIDVSMWWLDVGDVYRWKETSVRVSPKDLLGKIVDPEISSMRTRVLTATKFQQLIKPLSAGEATARVEGPSQ